MNWKMFNLLFSHGIQNIFLKRFSILRVLRRWSHLNNLSLMPRYSVWPLKMYQHYSKERKSNIAQNAKIKNTRNEIYACLIVSKLTCKNYNHHMPAPRYRHTETGQDIFAHLPSVKFTQVSQSIVDIHFWSLNLKVAEIWISFVLIVETMVVKAPGHTPKLPKSG